MTLFREDSVSALRLTSPLAGDLAELTGYYAAGDGGGGSFYWDNVSTATDNGGTIIKASPTNGRWFRVFQQPVNVQWFGAKGDGSTDDTTNINNTIGAITAGEVVFQPNLTYVISGTLTVSNPLIIDLSGATLQFASSVSGTSIAAFTVSHSDVTIRNGIINGTYNPAVDVPTPGVGPLGVKDTGAFANLRLERIVIQNVQSYGISTADASNLQILNCKLINTGYISIFCNNTVSGLVAGLVDGNLVDRSGIPANHITQPCVAIRGSSAANYTTGLIFTGNKLIGQQSPTDPSAACMELRFMRNCTVDSNAFINGTLGLSLATTFYITATANTCFGCGYGMEVFSGSFNTVDSNVISGNNVASTTGILIDGNVTFSTFNTISNNNISDVTLVGIEVYKGSSNNNIIGGQVTTSVSGQTCIYLIGESNLVTGVMMNGSSTSAHGITLDCSGVTTNPVFICSGTIISGCTFASFTSAAINLYAPNGGTISGLRFMNNTLDTGSMFSSTLLSGATVPSPYYYGNSPEIVGSRVILATGTNASAGVAPAMTAGSVTVANTLVTANSIILLSVASPLGVTGTLSYTKVAGTSFTITSSSATDTSTVAWVIVN